MFLVWFIERAWAACNVTSYKTFLSHPFMKSDQGRLFRFSKRIVVVEISLIWICLIFLICLEHLGNILDRANGLGPVFESPGNFSDPWSHSKISNLTFTELFQSVIVNMNRGFLRQVSGAYGSPFLDTDELKIALRARKVSGVFEKQTGPWSVSV